MAMPKSMPRPSDGAPPTAVQETAGFATSVGMGRGLREPPPMGTLHVSGVFCSNHVHVDDHVSF